MEALIQALREGERPFALNVFVERIGRDTLRAATKGDLRAPQIRALQKELKAAKKKKGLSAETTNRVDYALKVVAAALKGEVYTKTYAYWWDVPKSINSAVISAIENINASA